MRFKNIASGSAGNATYVGSDHTHILIDTGVSRKRIYAGLKTLDLSPKDVSAILITHEHTDHVCSLDIIEQELQVPVFLTDGTKQSLREKNRLSVPDELVHVIRADETFAVGDITVKALQVSHDAREPVCYKIQGTTSRGDHLHEDHGSCGSERGCGTCAVVTDLGQYDEKLLNELQGLSLLMLEANHDLRMLQTGPYPYPLKRRIASGEGHLSNEAAGHMLSQLLHEGMQHVALGHLSKKNNYRELALLAVQNEIDAWDNPWHAEDFPIDVADPETGTPVFVF